MHLLRGATSRAAVGIKIKEETRRDPRGNRIRRETEPTCQLASISDQFT